MKGSKWYSDRCINYGKFPGTQFYRMCQQCKANMYTGPCNQFKIRKFPKYELVKENENGIK